MRARILAATVSLALVATACGTPAGSGVEVEGDEPLIQIVSEGGFVPVEMALNNGPRYTVLGDGTLVFEGVHTMEYPGPLLPPYMTGTLDSEQMSAILDLVERIGLPDIEDETDDSAARVVADAPTEVVTYWDDAGKHRLAVYALGIADSPSQRDEAFLELVETLDGFAADVSADPYQADRVRVIAGPGSPDPEFEDLRSWPLESTDLSGWEELANGWLCMVTEGPVPQVFEDATQATLWEHPERGQMKLLVRPLLPGEPDCPS